MGFIPLPKIKTMGLNPLLDSFINSNRNLLHPVYFFKAKNNNYFNHV